MLRYRLARQALSTTPTVRAGERFAGVRSFRDDAQQHERKTTSAVLHRSLKSDPLQVVSAHGTQVTFSNGQTINDTTCGAGVACIGYDNKRVRQAMVRQIEKFSYCNSMFFTHSVGEALARELVDGTNGEMTKAYIMSSGSEAMEAAMKMARQYFMELSPRQSQRANFIAREGSYHGTTLGSLSMSGHVQRRSLFRDLLMPNIGKVSACNAYRGIKEGQTTAEYVQELADELDMKFQELGPSTVCAFVAEPVVGATLGCVPAVPGYLKAMKEVCDKYGALLILDEVMSGMGRCGSLHVWQEHGIVPDIQTVAKGLGGGYAPIAGILINEKVTSALERGSGAFSHGHTYQGHPVACAAALEVQRVIKDEDLVSNVRRTGTLLRRRLHEYLDDHPFVGNIRGEGLFLGIEFVIDKKTKAPFPRQANISQLVHEVGMFDRHISLYPGTGTKDGVLGDHVLLCPAYNLGHDEIEEIAQKVKETIHSAFLSAQLAPHLPVSR